MNNVIPLFPWCRPTESGDEVLASMYGPLDTHYITKPTPRMSFRYRDIDEVMIEEILIDFAEAHFKRPNRSTVEDFAIRIKDYMEDFHAS